MYTPQHPQFFAAALPLCVWCVYQYTLAFVYPQIYTIIANWLAAAQVLIIQNPVRVFILIILKMLNSTERIVYTSLFDLNPDQTRLNPIMTALAVATAASLACGQQNLPILRKGLHLDSTPHFTRALDQAAYSHHQGHDSHGTDPMQLSLD